MAPPAYWEVLSFRISYICQLLSGSSSLDAVETGWIHKYRAKNGAPKTRQKSGIALLLTNPEVNLHVIGVTTKSDGSSLSSLPRSLD